MSAPDVPLPPRRLRFMNEDDAKFVQTGKGLAATLHAHGLGPRGRLLDVGSGYGRLAVGLMNTGYEGRYLGFDVLGRHVRWCRQNLTTDRRYRFVHLDVVNARYNPEGTIPAEEARFPTPDRSRDYCAVFGVFTHFYADDIRRYLAEIRRVLVPGGQAATTWFLFDEARLPAVTGERSAVRLVHELDELTRCESTEDPLEAIGYDEAFARRLVAEAGLEVVSVTRGSWAGDQPPEQYQDLMVLRRPERAPAARPPAPSTVTRVRRRLGRLKRRVLGRG